MVGRQVETYSIIQQEHDGSEPPRPLLIPENHLTYVTDITNLGVTKTEFPQDQRTMQQSLELGVDM